MTQEEIIKLAHAAGFNWPDIQATTIEQRLERFAYLVAANEREKFTNTQEFVTLPREVVEQALDALLMYKPMVTGVTFQHGLEAMQALRAALEQPQNHVPDVGNMVQSGWKLVPVEPTCGMVLAGEHSMKQHDFFRLDAGYRAMLAAAPTPPAVDHPKPAYLLRYLVDDISVDAMDLIAAISDAGLGNYSINMMLPARVCVAMCKRFLAVEQEPVARVVGTGHLGGHFDWCKPGLESPDLPSGTPLYTHPKPQC